MIRPEVTALSRSRLSWAKQNYVRADTLTAANAKLVAAQNDIDLVHAWGAGEVASADGLRFVVPIRTITPASTGWWSLAHYATAWCCCLSCWSRRPS